jgi:hypothetical protein
MGTDAWLPPQPELLPVDFDDEVFAGYTAEYGWGDPDA